MKLSISRGSAALGLVAFVVTALTGCGKSINGEQVAEWTALVDANQVLNERLDQARITAVTAAVANGQPGQTCPGDALIISSGNRMNLQLFTQAELPTAEGGRLANFRRRSEGHRVRLSLTGPDAVEAPPADHRDLSAITPDYQDKFLGEVNEMGTTEWWQYDIVVVETQRVEATTSGDLFTPGYLQATAVIFDYASETVVCQATVEARHEDNERVSGSSQSNNATQLMVTLEGRIKTNALHALGQPTSE